MAVIRYVAWPAALGVGADDGAARAHCLRQDLGETLLVRGKHKGTGSSGELQRIINPPPVAARPPRPRRRICSSACSCPTPSPTMSKRTSAVRQRSAKASISRSSLFHGIRLEICTNVGGSPSRSHGCGRVSSGPGKGGIGLGTRPTNSGARPHQRRVSSRRRARER